MKKKFLVGMVTGMFLFGLAAMANANLIVYYDQANFLANAGSVVVYDFESDTPGYISSPNYHGGNPGAVQDFSDFSIDATSAGIYSAKIRQQNGNNDIYMNSYSNGAALNVIFDDAVTAFGFTYIAEGNQNYDHSTFSLLGTTWDLGTPGNSGFFGVIETTGTIAVGTAFSFGQQTRNWSGVSFDNITHSSNSPVPVPATMLLFGTGLAGLMGLNLRKKKIQEYLS